MYWRLGLRPDLGTTASAGAAFSRASCKTQRLVCFAPVRLLTGSTTSLRLFQCRSNPEGQHGLGKHKALRLQEALEKAAPADAVVPTIRTLIQGRQYMVAGKAG